MSVSTPLLAPRGGTRERLRLRLQVQGVVQGLGFRPYVYRLAIQTGVSGWVCNSQAGVIIEVEGSPQELRVFHQRLEEEPPSGSAFQRVDAVWLEPAGWEGFEIRPSDRTGESAFAVRPDIATCAACLQEIFDPGNRRYGYPFTNCTHCGPRYTILERLPYDRENTSMVGFTMCPECRAEYEDPADRRFHAQPNACPNCGPHLELWSTSGEHVPQDAAALRGAAEAIKRGQILAVKGLGGFHLITDARSESAVQALRQRKHREEKPFAVMLPGIAQVKELCRLSPLEEELLRSPEAPVVLLQRLKGCHAGITEGVAPGNPFLGVMLPYTPLHHLLLAALEFPVVATSGNRSDEPICIDEVEARERLRGIADGFLVHNRPIVRHVDDSVVRVVAGRELMVRRARGYAPLPIAIQVPDKKSATKGPEAGSASGIESGRGILAVGGQNKNAVAVTAGNAIALSQHIGDLDTVRALSTFRGVIQDLQKLFGIEFEYVVSDLHPDYRSTREAQVRPQSQIGVQHHFAHVLACMAENKIAEPLLGIAWDGTGYGLDGMIWGGEFLRVENGEYDRFATFRPFRLPGNNQAIREPRRSAMGMLYERHGSDAFELSDVPTLSAFNRAELQAVIRSLERPFNAPLTTAVGRLFDAVASMLGVHQRVSYEGQAAMALEWLAAEGADEESSYPFALRRLDPTGVSAEVRVAARDALWQADWAPVLDALLEDVRAKLPPARMAWRFHRSLIELLLTLAAQAGLERVALSGGCFQNTLLLEGAISALRAAGHRVYWHRQVPTHDGGLALGQAFAGLNAWTKGARR